jgi:hypothetical protein
MYEFWENIFIPLLKTYSLKGKYTEKNDEIKYFT